MPGIERTDPPYLQVVAKIRSDVQAGRLRPGDRVPSAREITREWRLSLATATKVLAALRSEGLARSIPGVGTVVADPPAATPHDHITSIVRTGKIYAVGNYARIESADVTAAPPHVAEALALETVAQVIRRRRITFQDDQPVTLSTSWFDGALAESAPSLLRTERLSQGTPGYIEERTGRRVVRGRDSVTARPATGEEAARLGIEPGMPVLHGENWYYDDDDVVVEFGEFVTSGTRKQIYDYRVV
jgi:DNA-binding GntR family transcriptional regulator